MRSIQHVVLSCTKSEAEECRPPVRLREVERVELDDRAAAWIDAISGAVPSHPVRELYLGEYWQEGLGSREPRPRDGRWASLCCRRALGWFTPMTSSGVRSHLQP